MMKLLICTNTSLHLDMRIVSHRDESQVGWRDRTTLFSLSLTINIAELCTRRLAICCDVGVKLSGSVNYWYQWVSGSQGDRKGTLSDGDGTATGLPYHAEPLSCFAALSISTPL